jgi:hypothetical protein
MNTEQLTARFEAAVGRYAAAERAWTMFGMPDDGILMDQLCAAEEEKLVLKLLVTCPSARRRSNESLRQILRFKREQAREALLAHKRAQAGEGNRE